MKELISLGEGSGGRLTAQLIAGIIENFGAQNGQKDGCEDCTFVEGGLAVTTDGFTVSPRFFPGGDMGHLSICGSTNDLAVRGVRPQWLTMGMIIEEGLPREELHRLVQSAAATCAQLGVTLAAGDTKVVPKGAAEGVFFSVTALGHSVTPKPLGMDRLKDGDTLILTTSPGRHGTVIAALRYGLDLGGLESDCAPLWPLLEPLLSLPGLHCMRDCTRGGLGTVLCEWAESTGLGMEIEEEALVLHPSVTAICDILGFDPLYLASEGCALIACAPEDADTVLSRLRAHPLGREAALIGHVTAEHGGIVGMKTSLGGTRIVDMPIGEILPRIC
ncbi:MAG: hydrogenase expression/formation protein HypE [Pyramidobacter sp.]|nr:hydrogenase expression/formation protein HypE [Pyramidobacter sp.]